MDIGLVTLLRTAVETVIAHCTTCCAVARGHHFHTSFVLAAVHGLLGLPGRCARSSLHSFAPPPPHPRPPHPSPSLIGHIASVDVKQNVYFKSAYIILCDIRLILQLPC